MTRIDVAYLLGTAAASVRAANPTVQPPRGEAHRSQRSGWLRAAVLGADDGIVATASLMIGVAASSAPAAQVLVAGLAGLVAGALSMAAGEYVSVSSQRDAENADIALEITEHKRDAAHELRELTALYVDRGLEPGLAQQVAAQLSARDALGAHLRDEFGFTAHGRARPGQAAMVSAASFALGAAMPIMARSWRRLPSGSLSSQRLRLWSWRCWVPPARMPAARIALERRSALSSGAAWQWAPLLSSVG